MIQKYEVKIITKVKEITTMGRMKKNMEVSQWRGRSMNEIKSRNIEQRGSCSISGC